MPVSAAVQQALTSDVSDAEFAQRIASGDHVAFEVLMRKHNRMLYRTARAILRDDADAEDALQLAYLSAYRSIGSFRGESRLSTWLTRIVVNECMMRARRRGREAMVVPLDSVSDDEGNIMSSDGIAVRKTNGFRIRTRLRVLP